MARKQWTGTGTTDAATATTANSGGAAGDAFDALPLTGDGTAKYSSLNPPFTGWRWLRLQSTTGRARGYHAYTASDTLDERKAVRLRTDPGVQVIWSAVATDFTFPVQLQLVTTGGVRHLVLRDTATQLKDYGTFTFGSGVGTFVWVDIAVSKGTSGHIKCKVYSSAGTLIDTFDNTANTGTLQFIRSQWGGNTGAMDLEVTGIDANSDAPSDYVGIPSVSNVAPTGYMMDRPDPFEPGLITVTANVDDTDGTIASAAVSIISGPNFPTVSHSYTGLNTAHCVVTATFTGLPSARYLTRLSAADNAGAAVTAAPGKSLDCYIDTYATTGDVSVYAVTSSTGYTAVGAGSVATAITDSDDASYAETAAAPSAAELRVEMCAFRINRPIKAKVRAYRDPSGGAAITVTPKLYAHDNTTLIETGTPFTLSSSVAETVVSFTASGLTTKASRRDLIVCLSATQ